MNKLLLLLLFIFSITSLLAKKNILLVHSYHKEYEWCKNYTFGLLEVLPISEYKISHFYLDAKKYNTKQNRNIKLALKHIEENDYDSIIFADDFSLSNIGPLFANLEIPIFFLGINGNPRNYFYKKQVPNNFLGVLERPFFKRTILTIKNILPETKEVLVMFDGSSTSNITIESIMGKNHFEMFGMNITIMNSSKYKIWKNTVRENNGKYDVIIFGLYHTLENENNDHVDENEVIEWCSQNTPVPSFGFWSFSIGHNKSLGGYILSGQEQGRNLAHLIIDYYNGKPTKTFYSKVGYYKFSLKQLEKWNITLPAEIDLKSDFID